MILEMKSSFFDALVGPYTKTTPSGSPEIFISIIEDCVLKTKSGVSNSFLYSELL